MAWEVGIPRSAVNEPPPPPLEAAGASAWISPPAAERSGVGEEWRIGATLTAGMEGGGGARLELTAEMGGDWRGVAGEE